MSRAIFVLSTIRAGSSCVAGALHRLGVDMGQGHLQPGDGLNPGGYYEDLRWQAVSKRIAGHQFNVWYNEPTQAELDDYRKLVVECSKKPIWGVKNPRMAFTFQYVWPMLDDVRVVWVKRNHEDSVRSVERQSQIAYNGSRRMTREEAEKLVIRWRQAVEERIATFPGPVYEAHYERLFVEPVDALLELHDFCYSGIEHLSKRIIAPAMTWLNESYRHYGNHHADDSTGDGVAERAGSAAQGWTRKRPCCGGGRGAERMDTDGQPGVDG